MRQLGDAKIKPLTETFGMELTKTFARACDWMLVPAHAMVGEVTTIAGYLGASLVVSDIGRDLSEGPFCLVKHYSTG